MSVKVKGLRQLKSNFQKEFRKLSGPVTEKGLRAGLMQGAAYASELTPVDTSNLINSQYIFTNEVNDGFKGGVGYTANYAEFVHDGGPKNWQKRGASDLFLTLAFERNQPQIFKAIALGSRL